MPPDAAPGQPGGNRRYPGDTPESPMAPIPPEAQPGAQRPAWDGPEPPIARTPPDAQPREQRPPWGGPEPTASLQPTAHQSRRGRTPRSRTADLVYVVVLFGVLASLLWIWLSGAHVKEGTVIIGGWMLVAAIARFILPNDRAGLLTARRRAIDVAAFVILGAGLITAALVVPNPS